MLKTKQNQQIVSFFAACCDDNVAVVAKNLKAFKNTHDVRATDIDQRVYNGFCGIHYAALFKSLQVLQMLLPYEYDARLKESVLVDAPFISNGAKIQLEPQCDSLSICVVSDFLHGAETILAYYLGKKMDYLAVNIYNQSALYFAALNRNATSMYLLKQRQLYDFWGLVDELDSEITFVGVAAQAGRRDIFAYFDQVLSSSTVDSLTKDTVATHLLFVDPRWMDIAQMARVKLDSYERLGTTEAEKEATAQLIELLLEKALSYAQTRAELREVVNTWQDKCVLWESSSVYNRRVNDAVMSDNFLQASQGDGFSGKRSATHGPRDSPRLHNQGLVNASTDSAGSARANQGLRLADLLETAQE